MTDAVLAELKDQSYGRFTISRYRSTYNKLFECAKLVLAGQHCRYVGSGGSKKDLMGWKLGRVITVLDRGFNSEENLRCLQRGGVHYITGEKMRSGKEDVEEALSKRGRFKTVNSKVEIKEVIIGDGEARKRYVLVKNPAQEERDRKTREKNIKRIQEELKAIGDLHRELVGTPACTGG